MQENSKQGYAAYRGIICSSGSPLNLFTINHLTKKRVGVAAFFFLLGFCFASWASRIPYLQQKLALTEAELGLVLLAIPCGSFISLPLAGWLVTRYGSKKILVCAGIFYALALIAIAMADTKMQLLAALFCFGIGGNTGNISVNTQAVAVEKNYGRNIMASFHGVWSLAGFAGAAFGAVISSFAVAPLSHFSIVGGICLLLIIINTRFLLDSDIRSAGNTPAFAWPDRSLLTLGLIAFCSMMCEGAMFDWSGIYFKKVVKPDPALVGVGYAAFMSTMAASRFVSDYFTNRLGFKSVVRASGVIIMSGLLLSVIFPYFYTATAGFLLVGIGVSSIVPLVYSASGKSKRMSSGAALASVSSVSFFGFLLGPPLIGLLAGISDLRLSFAVMAFVGLCVTILSKWSNNNY